MRAKVATTQNRRHVSKPCRYVTVLRGFQAASNAAYSADFGRVRILAGLRGLPTGATTRSARKLVVAQDLHGLQKQPEMMLHGIWD